MTEPAKKNPVPDGDKNTPKSEAANLEKNIVKFFSDLEALRLSPEDTAEIGTREVLTRVPVSVVRDFETGGGLI
jgi:hypothetical protein